VAQPARLPSNDHRYLEPPMSSATLEVTSSQTAATSSPRGSTRWLGRTLLYATLTIGAVFSGFPFFWMLMTSLKPRAEATRLPPTVLPHHWLFSNYVIAWQAAPFGRYFLNTVAISACVVAGVVITGTLAAYAFARLEFPGRNVLFALLISTLMIPFEATLIPNFIIVKNFGWYNTYFALIIPWTANVFSVFLLRQFFLTLPQDLFDAAMLDGAGAIRSLWSVALPLARAPIGAVTLFAFLSSWNSLLWPLIVTGSQDIRPIQLGLSVFLNSDTNEPQLLMAANAFTILPIILLFFVTQRTFMQGIASTGLRG
jgi:multiple sugar transport system permease protein